MADTALLNLACLMTDSLRLDRQPPPLPGDVDWPQLAHHADGHSLTPLLYATWREAGLLDRLPDEIRARLARAYADNERRNRHIRQEFLEVHHLLAEAGVPHLALKGWPLVEQLYPEPAQRVLYDHDFLVPPDRAEQGWQALRAAGFRPLPAKDEWIEKHLPPLWRNDGYPWDGYLFDPDYPRPVELHLRLWEEGWRGLRVRQLPDLWRDARTVSVAGEPLQLLSAENTLVHLAVHFAGHLVEGEARLNQLLDLARFAHRATAGLDWQRALAQARRANVGRFVYASLRLAGEVFGAPPPPGDVWQALEGQTPPAFRAWLERQGVAEVLSSDYRRRRRDRAYELTFLAANSAVERLGIIRFAALPPLDQLRAKYNLRHRWLGPLAYPRYVADRVREFL